MSTNSNDLRIKIAPSLLAADFSRLAEEVRRVEEAGCDLIHIDVMDGHFVPNITVGPFIVKAIRKLTKLPLDTHLMIENPLQFVKDFAEAGSDHITIHAEACQSNLAQVLQAIKGFGKSRGVSLRPATPLDPIKSHLQDIDMVLLMTVNPGFGGQSFMPEVLPKVEALRRIYTGDIEVDGGINKETCKKAVAAGANVLVAGTAVFGQANVKQAIEDLRCRS